LKNTILILFISLLLACDALIPESSIIERNEIFGKYVANFGDFVDYVEVRHDSTYIHYFRYYNNEYTDTGYWEFHCNTFDIVNNRIPDSIKSMPKNYPPAYIPSEYKIVLYGFIRRHAREYYGYEPRGFINTTPHTWITYLYKSPAFLEIRLEYNPDLGQMYLKQFEGSIK